MAIFLVAGVSGHTGAAVAQSLLDQKQKVRVLVREAAKGERWKKRGAEVAVGSLEDVHALGGALRGADAAYLLIPPTPFAATGILARGERMAGVYAQAISGSHLRHVVFLSSVGAQIPEGTGMIVNLHRAEKTLRALKAPLTFLRASYFMENWASSFEPARNGQLPTFFPPDLKFPQVASHDIGRVAAELITDHPKAHRTVELAGPVEASSNDVAAALGKILGEEVKTVPYPASATAATLQGFGFSAEYAALFQEMNEALSSGRVAWENPAQVRRGKETLEQTLGALLKKG
jgi:uncharacterized protein YbjT (DUF2867 family)